MIRHLYIPSLLAVPLLLSALLGARTTPGTGDVYISYALPTTLTQHEPVSIMFTISNQTSESAQVDLGQDRKGAYLLSLTEPNGVRIDLPQYGHEGISRVGTFSLGPGQKFTQTLLLNEWYPFETPGHYWLQIRMAHPILTGSNLKPIVDPGFAGQIEIKPRNPEYLEGFAKQLARRIEDSTSYEEAAEATTQLSYTVDPIAVPYLEEALHSRKLVEPIAIEGLERIANPQAIAALISSLQPASSDLAEQSRGALRRIWRQTPDPALKREIESALQSQLHD